jgi:Ca2+-binding RTX toxin-like protein
MTSQLITGTSKSDSLIVTRGDTVEGGAGADQITFNDPVSGAWEGAEATLVFNQGFGSDVLRVATYGQEPRYVIQFGAGLAASDLELVSRGNRQFSLQFKNGQGTIDLPTQGDDPHAFNLAQLLRIEFADGTVWSRAQIDALAGTALRPGAVLDGTNGSDTLVVRGYGAHTVRAGSGDDTIVAGGGNLNAFGVNDDKLQGESGNDTYRFETRWGHDTVVDGDGANVIEFGATVQPSSLTVSRTDANLIVREPGTGSQLTVVDFFTLKSVGGEPRFPRISFADGSFLEPDNVRFLLGGEVPVYVRGSANSDTLAAGSGAHVLNGASGDDRLISGAGNDVLGDFNTYEYVVPPPGGVGTAEFRAAYGGSGTDTYVFSGAFGQDQVLDVEGSYNFMGGAQFASDADVIEFTDLLASDLDFYRVAGTDSSFLSAYGSSEQAQNLLIQSKKSSDLVVVLGQYNPSYLNYSASARFGVGFVKFADGTIWDRATLDQNVQDGSSLSPLAFQASPGRDGLVLTSTVYTAPPSVPAGTVRLGTPDDDVMDGAGIYNGGRGNDTLMGSENISASTTYLYQLGDGDDVVGRYVAGKFATYANPVALLLGAGITLNDLRLTDVSIPTTYSRYYGGGYTTTTGTVSGEMLSFASSAGSIRAIGGVTSIQLADGTVLDEVAMAGLRGVLLGRDGNDTLTASAAGQQVDGRGGNDSLIGGIGNDTLTGGDGSDTLSGSAGNDSLRGGLGNDELSGGAGSDTYQYLVGDGADLIHADSLDTLNLGFDQSALKIGKLGATVANAVVLTNGTTGDSITLDNAGQWNGLKLNFNSGTSLTGADVLAQATKPDDLTLTGTTKADTLTGKDGNDTLSGLAGNDTLAGGKGKDSLIGGKGNDTYLFNRGDGQDTIVDTDSTLFNSDLLKLGGATSKQLWLTKTGKDLGIQILGTQDKVTVQNWFAGSSNQVEKITASDGKSLSASKVQALVNAMASFTPPADAASLPANTPAAVTKLIASSWV